nr:hypothetical protein BDOA9_0202910 [Bradyrhizobium sp. DOA9]
MARQSAQHTDPGGIFYRGIGPTEARRTLEQIAEDFDVGARDRVIIVDYHSCLGPYGCGELQTEEVSGLDGHERAVRIFGPSATSPILGTSAATSLYGTQDDFWEGALGDRHTYICLEYGTYSPEVLAEGRRKEQWLFVHRPQDGDSELTRAIRNATKNNSYPQRMDWKEMVAWRSHMVHRQALEAFTT